MILPALEFIRPFHMVRLDFLQNRRNVLLWVLHVLNTDDAAEKEILRSIVMVRWYDTRAIDQVDPLHQRDILPHLGLTGDRRDFGDCLAPEGVDDARLADVGVADQANADLFPVLVEDAKLPEQIDQGTTPEGVPETGPHGACWVVLLEDSDPGGLVQLASISTQMKRCD